MIYGIMQPYFFPYIGYFQLMQMVDKWIFFDEIQFIEKGWVNRNRILDASNFNTPPDPKSEKKLSYLTVPLNNKHRNSKISDLQFDNSQDLIKKVRGNLSRYKRRAPHFKETLEMVLEAINIKGNSLSDLLFKSLITTRNYIGIETPIIKQSAFSVNKQKIDHPGKWALEYTKVAGGSGYINPCSGRALFRPEEFEKEKLKLGFMNENCVEYVQRIGVFVPYLSIIDVCMFNSPKEIREILMAANVSWTN